MKKLVFLLQISLVLSLATPFITNARDLTWTGAASGNWNDSANFSPMYVPAANDTVTIDAASNHPRLTTNTSVYRLVLLGDTLDLNGYQLNIANEALFSGGWLVGGQLNCRGTIATFAGTVINVAVDVDCTTLELNGSVFNQSCYFKAETGDSQGGNEFYLPVSLVHVGTSGSISLAMDQGDTFHDTLYVTNNSDGNIHLTQADTSHFKNYVRISSTGTGSIHFGSEGGISILETNGHLVVENGEFTTGQLFLKNIEQQNTTGHRMVLTGTGGSDGHSLLALENCNFTGEVDFTAPNLLLSINRFDGTAQFTKTGGYDNVSTGDNLFSGDASFTNSSTTGHLLLTGSREDRFLGTAQFTSGSMRVISGYGATTVFEGDVVVNSATVGFYRLKFTGEAEQTLSGTTGHLYGETELDKASGSVTAIIPIAIDRRLTFTRGYLVTDSVNLVTFLASGSATGATDSSFVSGPVKKMGNTAFEFPVGKDGDYRPIAMSAPDSITDVFVAEYRSDSMDVNTSDRDTTLGRILRNKYWNLFQHTGSSGVYITLSWNSNHWISDTNVTVAAWSGALWQNLGRGSMTGDSLSGTITSAIEAVHYYQFAIAYERSTGLYLSNNCFNITDGAQLQYCLNHSGNGDILNITTDIILPDVSGPAGTISYPLVVGNGVVLQGYHNGNDTKWWEVGCPLITSGFKAIYNDQKLSDMFLFGLEPGAIFRGLRVRGGSCHYQDYNMDAFLCGGIILMSDNSLPDASISNCEISCFSYAGIFKGDGQGDLNLENNYVHKVKGKGFTTGIGYGVWTMGHDIDLSIINFDNNLFDDCKAAIDGQGDPMDWNILNCTFSQFFYSEDINKHNYNLFTMDKCPCQGTATINNYWDYLGSASNGATYHGSFWEIAAPCVAANCTIPITTYPGHDFGPLYHGSLSSSALYNGLQGIPFYDVGGANTDIRNCIFHKRWSIDLNGNINLPYPNLDNSRHGNIQNKISIENNTFATDKFDKDIVLSQNMNNSGFAKIADNYILADVWSADVGHIMEGGNSFGYRPGTAVTATAPQPYNFSMQLMNDAATDPLGTSYSLSATGGHQYIQHVEKNEPFKINLENTLNIIGLTYIIRPNPQQGPSGTTPGVLSTDNYFHQGELITNNTTVSLPAINTTGLYGIDVLAIDANDQDPTTGELYDFKGSEWKHIPVIVKDDSEDQVLYFNIKDSFLEANQQTVTGVMKQAYLNDQLLWEEDIADGGDGWEYVRVDLKDNIPGSSNSPYLTVLHTNGAPNVLSFRISTGNTPVDADMVHGVKVWVDDVYLKKTGSLTGDNLIRDGSVEIVSQEELGTGVSLEPLWFRETTDDFACTNYSRSSAVFISSTDRKSGSQAILLEMPEIFDICSTYPANKSVSAGTVIDFTDLLSCVEIWHANTSLFGYVQLPNYQFNSSPPAPLTAKYFVANNVEITGQSTIVTFKGAELAIAPGITITVSNGAKLVIENDNSFNSYLFACSEMWESIIVEPGAILQIDGNKNSGARGTLIEGAVSAIECDGCKLECRFAEFNHNLKAINVVNDPLAGSYIRGCDFRTRGGFITKAPYTGYFPADHVTLESITNSSFPIGNATGSSGYENSFYEALRAISLTNSSATIIRSRFGDIGNKNGLYHTVIPGSAISIVNDGSVPNVTVTIGGVGGTGLIERNIFERVNIAVRAYNDCPGCSLNVIGNEFDNSDITTGGATSAYHNTAVTIQSPIINTGFKPVVKANKLKNFRMGIHCLNIEGAIIEDNGPFTPGTDYMFNYPEDFDPDANNIHRGIWLQDCPNAFVQGNRMDNAVELTVSGMNFRGIDMEHSTDARINCNTIINLPVSMRFLGSCDGTLLRKNEMAGYNEGIRLESATIGDQFQINGTTSDEEPLDNIWNDPPLATNTPTDRVTGNSPGGQFNWYFRSQGGIYDPLDNGTTSQIIFTQQDAAGTIDCNDQSNRQSRNVRFGSTVGDSLQFDSYEDENTWLARSYAYTSMKKDTTIMYQDTITDMYFVNFFNEIDTTNIGAFEQVLNMSPDSASRTSASALNFSIIPVLDLETGLQDALDVYLNVVANLDTLTGSDTLLLEQIANLDYYSGGKAIYMAAAILGLEVSPSIPPLRIMPGLFSQSDPKKSTFDNQIKIYPNPAIDFFVLVGPDDKFKWVELYDLHNKRVMCWSNALTGTPFSINVTAGIYAIRAVTSKNEIFWGKLVVMGR